MIKTPNEIRTHCRQLFEDHKATLVQNTNRFTIIDWRKASGDGTYYINYIVDKKQGRLIVSGDTGESIAEWDNELTVDQIRKFIRSDEGYYASKMQASTHRYTYDSDILMAEVKKHIDRESFVGYMDANDIDEELFYDDLDLSLDCAIDDGRLDDKLVLNADDLQTIAIICNENESDVRIWLEHCYVLSTQVYLWAIGFDMACEQLEL